MAYKLSENSLTRALRHLCKYGDTDVFPHLQEISFFADEEASVVAELTQLDLDSYSPGGAVEALAPKSRYGFRIVHQLSAIDNVLLLASVIEIAESIETKRHPQNVGRSFSYRFNNKTGDPEMFQSGTSYKDWLHVQLNTMNQGNITSVISTDISDFYARVNFHRLENLLDEAAPNHGAAKFIKKHIKAIRAKQSFGLPVGGSAARLLAELALVDTDHALSDEGFIATRFVDDFRVLLKEGQNPYDALGFLAEQLGINEVLSLNVAKTSVATREEALAKLDAALTDIDEEAEGVALEALTAELYWDDEPDED